MVVGSSPARALMPPVASAETLEMGTPSMTKRGVPSFTPLVLSELMPRMLMRAPPPPGEPETLVTAKPES